MARQRKQPSQPVVQYSYAGNSPGVPAKVLGEELARIEKRDGGVIPKVVVDESRPDEAPLHPMFEWDDEVAAELYRQEQVRNGVRTLRVTVIQENGEREKQVAYVSVTRREEDDVPRHYVSTARAMHDDDMRRQVLSEALAQLHGWQRRYGHLAELAGVVEAISASRPMAAAV